MDRSRSALLATCARASSACAPSTTSSLRCWRLVPARRSPNESSAPLPDASGLATFLRRWPETAHLAERLDPKPGASGKTTFDLGVTIGALEEFVRLIDALSIAHPDMRADADKARGAIPALRAKLRQAAN